MDWIKALAPYKPVWIEEPTSPDDVLGHGAIAKVRKNRLDESPSTLQAPMDRGTNQS